VLLLPLSVSILRVLSSSALAPGTEIAHQAHQLVVVLWRRRAALDDPVKQIGVGTIEQGFETRQLSAVQVGEVGLGKSAENEIAFLRAAMPAPEQQPPAAEIQTMILRVMRHALQIVHAAVFRSYSTMSNRIGGMGQLACLFSWKNLAQTLAIRPL
jgi:hypothetical protein